MRVFVVAAVLAVGLVTLVRAQEANPQAQIAFLAKALQAMQMQRNEANDRAVNLEARLALLGEENAALRKQIEELTPKPSATPTTPEK